MHTLEEDIRELKVRFDNKPAFLTKQDFAHLIHTIEEIAVAPIDAEKKIEEIQNTLAEYKTQIELLQDKQLTDEELTKLRYLLSVTEINSDQVSFGAGKTSLTLDMQIQDGNPQFTVVE